MRNVTSLYVYLFLLFMTRAVKIACPLSFLCLIPGCTRHFSRLGIRSMCTTVFTVNIKMKDMPPWEFDKYQGRLASSHARYPGYQIEWKLCWIESSQFSKFLIKFWNEFTVKIWLIYLYWIFGRIEFRKNLLLIETRIWVLD